MKITYNVRMDILSIVLSDNPVDESDEGNIVSMELLNASKRGLNPQSVEYAITGLKGA